MVFTVAITMIRSASSEGACGWSWALLGSPGGSWRAPGGVPGASRGAPGGLREAPERLGGPWGGHGGSREDVGALLGGPGRSSGGPGGIPGGPGRVLGGVPGDLGLFLEPQDPAEADFGPMWGRFGFELGPRSTEQLFFLWFLLMLAECRECMKIHINHLKLCYF